MDRRCFLQAGLGLGAALLAGGARADQATLRSFHAALARTPGLSVYANVDANQEGSAVVEGHLPADLAGVFYRNGPGRFELGGERYHHWFDGDGFAQAWRIAGGRVRHQGRFVETRKFVEESAAGQFLYPAFGTQVARRGIRDNDSMNTANTNLLPFGGHLFALWEGGSATEIDPDTLATLGIKTWRDDLKAMPFSAHPKLEPDGSLWNFGALPGSDKLALYRIDAGGAVLQTGVIDVPRLALQHDFALSSRHLVFVIPPYDILPPDTLDTAAGDAQGGRSLAERHVWAGSGAAARPARILVVDKATLALRSSFELAPQMAFHFANAYDEPGGAVTHVDLVLHDGDMLAALGQVMAGRLEPNRPGAHRLVRLTLDHVRGSVRTTVLLRGAEFPRVAPHSVGRQYRRLAVLSSDARNTSEVLDTVNLIDMHNGQADSWRFGPGWCAEEHVLVPRAGGGADAWLVGVVQDTRNGTSALSVFDAQQVRRGPVALARLPYRTPHCFHGNFLAA